VFSLFRFRGRWAFFFSFQLPTSDTMKVLIHYEDNDNSDLHKSLKITLPKSWKTGPTSKLLGQFIESYNANETFQSVNPLTAAELHLALRQTVTDDTSKSTITPLASDAVVIDHIADRADVYVMHGASTTLQEIADEAKAKKTRKAEELKNTVACTHFGCQNRFPRGGPYPSCLYHKAPPVFHETAKVSVYQASGLFG
jgi:hypothetical protein